MRESLGNPSDRSQYTNLFFGRAGEYFVASELLRRGLNPFLSPVDTGVDLFAHQEFIPAPPLLHAVHKVFLFQVKTTARDEYTDSISTRTVHEWWHKRINVVIVFWSKNIQPTCLILPPSLLYIITSGGFDGKNLGTVPEFFPSIDQRADVRLLALVLDVGPTSVRWNPENVLRRVLVSAFK
jgi:hypothetical protein